MTPPSRFNAARYCLRDGEPRDRQKTAMIVVHDAASPEGVERWTYAEIDLAVRSIAAGVTKKNLPRGSRIMIRMGNTSEYALLYFGILAAGYIVLPSSAQLTEREVLFLLEDSGACALAASSDLALSKLPPGVDVWTEADIRSFLSETPIGSYSDTLAEDPAFLVYTSGTSGEPKGVLHAHRSVWGRRPMYEGWYGISAEDRLLHTGAFNWTYTLGVGLTDPWANGATAILYNGEKDPSVWPKLIQDQRATIIAGIPTLYRQILKHCDVEAFDLSSLRHGLTAGEPMPLDVAEEWTARTGTPLYEALGMSECSTYISSSPSVPVRPGSPGKPQEGRRIAILPRDQGTEPLPPGEIGLLAVHRSDPGLMLKYWMRPEEDAAVTRGEWFVGGDLASMDADGYLWFEGRNDDVMTSMGYRVSPTEVEVALASHPDVAEVAVTELPAPNGVKLISAFVVPREGSDPDAESVLAHGARTLAPYKLPRVLYSVEALPRTANGKLQRNKLKGLVERHDK